MTEVGELPRRTQVWLSQNGLTTDLIAEVFHRTQAGVDLIVNQVPGSNNKERVINCYLLCGIKKLLESGEPQFDDGHARDLCRLFGCFDGGNHATYVKGIGNRMTGSKANGYELTQPGLRGAADLVRSMSTKKNNEGVSPM